MSEERLGDDGVRLQYKLAVSRWRDIRTQMCDKSVLMVGKLGPSAHQAEPRCGKRPNLPSKLLTIHKIQEQRRSATLEGPAPKKHVGLCQL